MEKFSLVKNDPHRTPEMKTTQRWIETFICGTSKAQNVVGNRHDDLGLMVTDLMFTNKNRWAHVCPFVRDSLDYDLFWIEESDLDDQAELAIERLIKGQISTFKNSDPSFDPLTAGRGAALPELWKTFLTFFPRVKHRSGGSVRLMDDLHGRLKPVFVKEGLMIGQFYAGCPQPSVYNPSWTHVLTSPYPAFAIRYMAKHDHLFISPGTPERDVYATFFP